MADPWSWKTVFETLLGTGVGACVGVGGIWWQTRAQNTSNYETRLTSSLFEASEAFNSILSEPEVDEDGRLASLDKQSWRFKNIAMLCNKDDQELVLILSKVCLALAPKPQEQRRKTIAHLMGVIAGWRNGFGIRRNYISNLKVMFETLEGTDSGGGS